MTTAEVALIVSGLALLVSIASLWANSLRPFKLSLLHDAPTFKLYKINPNVSGAEDGQTWWIPSFDIGISFYNTGRIPGEVLDIRIVAELAGHRSNRKFVFYPMWIVDCSRFEQDRTERFKWIKSAILRDWYPIMLGAQGEKDVHVVLESDRWDHKESGEMKLTFEVIAAGMREWSRCETYTLPISEDMFESTSSYTPYDEKIETLRKLEA
jgi:hypothetical protein